MNVLNYLFNNGFYPKPKGLEITKGQKGIFNDPKHAEFKEALLEVCSKKMALHVEALTKPVVNLEMKGEYNAIFRLYEELIEMLAAPASESTKQSYEDPVKKIKEETKKLFAKKKE